MALPRITALLLLGVALLPASARAGEAGAAHADWQRCLGRAYVERAAFSGRDPAADAALGACRSEETAYLSALEGSPLLDADDIAQAKTRLVARARAALLETVIAGPRAVLH